MLRLLSSTLFLFALLTAGAAEEPTAKISRTPPAEYARHLQPLLTDLKEVRALPKSTSKDGKRLSTDALLYETIGWVDDSGSALFVHHKICEALTDEGVKTLGAGTVSIRANSERLHLVRGTTTRPDGQAAEAKVESMPKDEFEKLLPSYDSELMRIVFPKVVRGATVESILVQECFVPVYPNEFVLTDNWGTQGSPARRKRLVLNLSENMAARLRTNGLGFALPPVKRTPLADGRVLLEWSADGVAPLTFEFGGPPINQTGPTLQITTFADWSAFGRCYVGLRGARDESTPTVKDVATKWAADKSSPRMIATQLFEHVSQDIRSTGPESCKDRFDARTADDVLTTRSGGCEDKVNLLHMLLREHGIESRFALVDTRTVGPIDRASAGAPSFNRVLLAVTLPGEGEVFCDPMIDGASFGMLSPGEVDRDTLLIKTDGTAEWAHTPLQSMGRQISTEDFTINPLGGYSGWITIVADGYLGTSLAQELKKRSKEEGRAWLVNSHTIGASEAEIIGYWPKTVQRADRSNETVLKICVARLAAPRSTLGTVKSNVPVQFIRLPFGGLGAERRTPMAVQAFEMQVHTKVRLPAGAKPTKMGSPPAFKKDTPALSVSMGRHAEGQVEEMESRVISRRAIISPEEHREIRELLREMQAHAQNGEHVQTSSTTPKPTVKTPR